MQTKIQNILGQTWTENALKACVLNLWSRDKLIGHKEADFCDPRYTVLLNYAKQYFPDNTEIKVHASTIKEIFIFTDNKCTQIINVKCFQLSQNITWILKSMMKRPKRKDIYPEQNAIAANLFQVIEYPKKKLRDFQ